MNIGDREKQKTTHTLVKLMKDLQARQQTLINLITRVGGRQNIQKWMDELLKIDWKLAETTKGKNKMVYTYTYKGYSIIESGDDAGLHFNGKKVNSKFVSIYSIDGFVELIDEHGLNWATRLRAEGKDPVKPNLKPTAVELATYADKKSYQKALEASFANNEWKVFWREEFVAQTGTATEHIPVYKHTENKFPERYNVQNLQITDKENAETWLRETMDMKEIESLNNQRFNLFIDHHFFGGIFAAAKDEYSYSTWCAMEDIVNENDYYSRKPEVVKAKAYLKKYEKQGRADSRAEFEEQCRKREEIRQATRSKVVAKLMQIPGMKFEYLSDERGGVTLVGGDRQIICQNVRYSSIEIWEAGKSVDFTKEITSEMVNNAALYYREVKAKDDYQAYKKAQGNKPCKSFEKWLQTVA